MADFTPSHRWRAAIAIGERRHPAAPARSAASTKQHEKCGQAGYSLKEGQEIGERPDGAEKQAGNWVRSGNTSTALQNHQPTMGERKPKKRRISEIFPSFGVRAPLIAVSFRSSALAFSCGKLGGLAISPRSWVPTKMQVEPHRISRLRCEKNCGADALVRAVPPGPGSKSVVNLKCLLKVRQSLAVHDLPCLARTIERQKRVKSEEYFRRQSGFCRYRFVCSCHFRAVWNS
jgi:hypothetical protein